MKCSHIISTGLNPQSAHYYPFWSLKADNVFLRVTLWVKTLFFFLLIVSDLLSWPVLLWHFVVKYCNYSLSHLNLKWFMISSLFYFPVFSFCRRLEIKQDLVLHSLPKQTQAMRVLVPRRPAPPLVVAFSSSVEESRRPAFQTLVRTSLLFSAMSLNRYYLLLICHWYSCFLHGSLTCEDCSWSASVPALGTVG